MSHLTLMGKLSIEGGKKYITVLSNGGIEHKLPIVTKDVAHGEWVLFSGQLCTASVPDANGVARKIHFGEGSLRKSEISGYKNELSVTSGTVVSVFSLRTTPLSSRKIVDFIVADGGNYYNCIAFGEAAQRLVDSKKSGDPINIYDATFQSRGYIKNGEHRTAYEVRVRHFV